MKTHARRRQHRVQMMEVGNGKKAHCLDCGALWFNMVAAAEVAANYAIDKSILEEDK
jgi:hypothetical protein